MSNKIVWVALVAVAIIAIGGYLFPQQMAKVAGNITSSDVTATNFTELTASVGILTPILQLGGNTAASSVTSQLTTTSCNAGSYSASSTLFAVQSPYTGSSTATIISITGTGQATTSSFSVGTSTLSTGLALSNVSASLVSTTNGAATTTAFTYMPGVLAGSAGYISPGASTFRTIEVNNTDYIVGFATSTATGAGAANYTPGVSCAVKIEWRQ